MPGKKKSLELLALRIAPWFAWSFSGSSDIARTEFPNTPQAGFLAHGSIYFPRLPISLREPVANADFVPVHSGGTAPESHGIPI